MKKQFLEIGRIVNTHGIRGDVKVQPWCDSPEFLAEFDRLFTKSRQELHVLRAAVHKGCVLMHLEGVDSVEEAQKLRNTVLYMNRDDVELEEGAFFIQDVIGLPAYDERVGRQIGIVKEISDGPAGDLYVIQDGDKTHYIPGVPAFLREVDLENGQVTFCTIEGLLADDDN
ncbi:MAG: ribosome maturation factor RimM [Clostridiales bacterium]|nr:ribosome maturation factor RimM [Clostridiales bacterium]